MSAHDFDFLHGNWRIDHRRLKERLAGCADWETFGTELTCRPVLGGQGNLDEGAFPSRGYHAMTLRLYEPATGEWSLYWITSQSSVIDPPVVGRFTDGTGEFFGPDTHNGIPVLVRYRWSDITPDSCRWAQAFSTDDGKTWETNWIMDLTRTARTSADWSDADDRARGAFLDTGAGRSAGDRPAGGVGAAGR